MASSRARQDKEMLEQFSNPDRTDENERRSWLKIRRAAATRMFTRRTR